MRSRQYIVNDLDPNSRNREILDLIPEGEESALTSYELARALHKKPRAVRNMIAQAREDGNIIAGNEHGYFIPVCPEELSRYRFRAFLQIFSMVCSLEPAFRLTGKHLSFKLTDWEGEDR